MNIKGFGLLIVLIAGLIISKPVLSIAELGSPMPAPMPQASTEANKGPTIDETLMWIKEKVEDDSNMYQGYFTPEYHELLYSGCNVNIVQVIYSQFSKIVLAQTSPSQVKRDYAPAGLYSSKFSLADMDPNAIDTMTSYSDANSDGIKMTTTFFRTIGKSKHVTTTSNDNYSVVGGDPAEYLLKNPQAVKFYSDMRQAVMAERVGNGANRYKTVAVTLSFADPGIAQRVATAFKYAINQCQQQRKETPLPQKKELF